MGSVIDKKQIDTFYHEHPRTYSLKSLSAIAKKLNLNMEYYEFPKRYGGNVRVFMGTDYASYMLMKVDVTRYNNDRCLDVGKNVGFKARKADGPVPMDIGSVETGESQQDS